MYSRFGNKLAGIESVMTRTLLSLALLAGSLGAADFSVGINIGPPPGPRVLRVRPASPGPGYVWVDGYWYPEGRRYRWHQGYWTRAPYAGAIWIAPRYENGRYFNGYWQEGDRRFGHDHRWDRDGRRRDWDRDRDHDRDHDRR